MSVSSAAVVTACTVAGGGSEDLHIWLLIVIETLQLLTH